MTITQQPDSLSLSGNLKTFKVADATADVDFTLRTGTTELLHQSYTPDSSGTVEIDVRRAVEDVLAFSFGNSTEVQEQTAIYADFTATIDGTAVQFRAVRCGVDRPADTPANFLTQNFLTWQPQLKRVTYYTPEFMTYYAVQTSTLKLKAYYTAADGTETTDTVSVAAMTAGHCYTAPMQYGVVSGLLSGKLPSYYDVWVEDASGKRLTYIQRYAADTRRGIDEDWVLFENSLGGIDCFRAYGTLNLRASHTHSTAAMGDDMEEYYVDTQRLYSKETGLLTQREAQWLLDFFPSRAKYIYTGSYIRRIVVTESTAEGAVRQEPVSFGFTFRFTDVRPLLNIARAEQPVAMLDITVPTVGSFTLPPRLSEFSHLQLAEGALFPVQDPYTESWGVTTLGEITTKLDLGRFALATDVSAALGQYALTADMTAALSQYALAADVTAGLAKKLDTAWFASLFTVYDTDGLKVEPNDYTKTVESIRAMFGFWTDRYLAALGKTDSVAYHEVYLTDENGNYLLDHDGNFITTTRMLAALEGGVNEDDLWALLAPDGAGDVYATAQIGLEHLTDALKEYMGTVDLSQYAKAEDVTLLQSYFTGGKANKALRLANTIAIGSATQPVFFTADGVPSVCGAYSTLLTKFGYDNSSRLLSLTVGGTDKSLTLPLATTSIAGLVSTDAQTFGGVKTFAAGSLVIGSGSQSVTLSVDADGNLKVSGGVWTEKFVSALGKNAGTTSTGMSEAEMWEALGTDSSTKVIPAEHLDLSGVSGGEVDLSGYYTSEQTDALLSKKSSVSHTHTKSQITDFPDSLKNPTALTIKLNGTEAASYDGSSAKTVNVTPSGIGAAASSHTHTKSQITDFPTSLKNPSALSWSGYSSGSYDGSAAKSITIPSNTNQLTNGAGFITSSGSISGNAATATKLQTARTLTIGSTGKTFNGTANVSWTLAEIGAAAASHTHSYTSLGATRFLNANTVGSGTTGGVTLYGNVENYAILFRQTSQFGTHGTVTGGWATYFTMDTLSDTRGWIFRKWNSGNVASIDINGNMTLSGAVTATNFIATSDMRLKDVLKDVVVGSEALANAPLFVFRWKQGEDKADHIGTSAQYWQEQCPEVVSETDGRLGVDYGALGVAAGVSLAREVVELRDRVRTLEERLAKLEALIAKTGGAE